jgi:hypothetical protein
MLHDVEERENEREEREKEGEGEREENTYCIHTHLIHIV